MSNLAERTEYLQALTSRFVDAEGGEGHTAFLMGEAGIGKTSLVNHFLKQLPKTTTILFGGCDPLSTPRPLGPLYDIASQLSPAFQSLLKEEKTRHIIFSALIDELSKKESVVLVFEDIHWADEATIDLIKFLSRRIWRHKILFILTYRDDEIHDRHGLKNIFGDLIPVAFSKIQLQRLSQQAVQQLATQHGNRSGHELYELTGGNPFYVTEILSGKGNSIPESVKDSILTALNSKDDNTRSFLEFLSILPARIEQDVMTRLEEEFSNALDVCLSQGIVKYHQSYYAFKHELFRITIEESLTPSKRRHLHKKMLNLIDDGGLNSISLSQHVHHALYADERKLVSEMAPRAAREASAMGAHVEASKLYAIAIPFAEQDAKTQVGLYERHAYECYLTNQIQQAINSQEKVLKLWRVLQSKLDEGNALRFLSRLWWYGGNRANAVLFADESIAILENGFPTRERAMAYSNLAQLYMLADDRASTLLWGHKAAELAERMNDKEIVCHALNNIGSVMMRFMDSEKEGEEILRRSLSIALEEGFHEHVARAYTNLLFAFVLSRRFQKAEKVFNEGFKYCEDRDLNSWRYYMESELVKMRLDTGNWEEAESRSFALAHENHPAMVRVAALVVLARIGTRGGNFDEARKFIAEAKSLASMTGESQRIVPVLVAQQELCWITGDELPLKEIEDAKENLFPEKDHSYHYERLTQWMKGSDDTPYEKAISSNDVRTLELLGATAAMEKIKSLMKEQGLSIPRGLRESTKTNPFQLTDRQIDVLKLLSEGLKNKEIAERLFISAKTVDHHIYAILDKLNVNSRTAAVSKAREVGLLK